MNGELFPRVPDPTEELQATQKNLAALLHNVGDLAKCRGCAREVYWVLHVNGRKTPYDRDGTNHFITCPVANKFRRGGQA